MKSSWFLSFLLVLLAAGCVSIKPLRINPDLSHVMHQVSPLTHDASPVTSHLFKATLDIKKHHLTGLLLIKRMDSVAPTTLSQPEKGKKNEVYRIVFANEIGMTFFDLELKYDSFRVVSCFESLNKKALIKILETDFRLLTGIYPVQYEKVYRQTATNNQVFYAKTGRYKIWETFSPSGDTLYTTAGKSTIADPVIISFLNYEAGFPSRISLENPVIGLKMSLRLLKR